MALTAPPKPQIGQKSRFLFRNPDRSNLYQNYRRDPLSPKKYEIKILQPLGGAQRRSKGPNRPKIEIFILSTRPIKFISKLPPWSTESTKV